jgi:hypothetical protein
MPRAVLTKRAQTFFKTGERVSDLSVSISNTFSERIQALIG